jgi:hypothetical protein
VLNSAHTGPSEPKDNVAVLVKHVDGEVHGKYQITPALLNLLHDQLFVTKIAPSPLCCIATLRPTKRHPGPFQCPVQDPANSS